jgi:hypothetical protein
MRAFKTLLAGSLLLAFTTFVDAQTVVRITGSTAFRAQTNQAIRAIFDASPGMVCGFVGGNADNANISIFKGFINGQSVTIKTSFTGAVDGQAAVVSDEDEVVLYLEDGNPLLQTDGTTAAVLGPAPGVQLFANASGGQLSDVAMLDHDPATTPFKPPGFSGMALQRVGVIAFKWMVNRGNTAPVVKTITTVGSPTNTFTATPDASGLSVGMTTVITATSGNPHIAPAGTCARIAGISGSTLTLVNNQTGAVIAPVDTDSTGTGTSFVASAPISNMTTQMAQAIWAAGSVSLATITGNPADDTQVVWAMGRDAGSGTRLTTFQESGIGYNTPVTQFTPQVSSGVVTAHTLATNPDSLLGLIKLQHSNAGDGGFNSGGSVATALAAITSTPLDKDGLPVGAPSGPTATGYYISYVGINDAATALNGGAKELTWNGVPYSEQAVREGRYTFWGYESLGYKSGLTGVKQAVADALADRIENVQAPAPKLIDMRCSRSTDGSVVLQDY